MKSNNVLRNKRSVAYVFTHEGAAAMEKENLKRRVEFRMNYEIVHYPNQLPPMPQKEAKS